MRGGPIDDVTVVGGGPAGAVAAIVLARRGHRVRLLERTRFPRPKLCGDTLNPGALAALAPHVDVSELRRLGRPLAGMRLSGPSGVQVEGRYPPGVAGVTVPRDRLDAWLLARAASAGVTVEHGVVVRGPDLAGQRARGIVAATAGGERRHPSRLVIGADGRGSSLARAATRAHTPPRPRRWAFGVYAEGVHDMADDLGEMHIRDGRYVGLAPVGDGVTNVCLVVARPEAARGVRAPWEAIRAAVVGDTCVGGRLADARPVSRPMVLGPMAVDVLMPGMPGLLLAGDAAGFIDPMTGDGLRLAIAGAVLAAEVADETLRGQVADEAAARVLAARRARLFGGKWQFNRSLRALVDAPQVVRVATWAAHRWPGLVSRVVQYAGDVGAVA